MKQRIEIECSGIDATARGLALVSRLRAAADVLERTNGVQAAGEGWRLEPDETDQGWRNHETMTAATQLAGNMTPGGLPELERVRAIVRAGVAEGERAAAELGDVPGDADALRRSHVADALRGYLELLLERREAPGLAESMSSAAMGRVDWLEISRRMLELVLVSGGEQL